MKTNSAINHTIARGWISMDFGSYPMGFVVFDDGDQRMPVRGLQPMGFGWTPMGTV